MGVCRHLPQAGDAHIAVEPWDWRYCAEKVRAQKYAFDENALKPYLSLPVMQVSS